jgi:hypothetical protein
MGIVFQGCSESFGKTALGHEADYIYLGALLKIRENILKR